RQIRLVVVEIQLVRGRIDRDNASGDRQSRCGDLHAIPIPVLEPGVLCIVGEKKLDWVECQRALVCVSAHGKHQRVESTDHCRLDVVAYPDGLRNSLLIGHPRDQYTYTWYVAGYRRSLNENFGQRRVRIDKEERSVSGVEDGRVGADRIGWIGQV